jgi:mRNA-degrading endonuclease HigB of HigAB toxin-antitoxin module
MHNLQILFHPTNALHVSGVTITHLQEHKTTVTTVSGNRYTVIATVKFTDKEYL